MTTNFIAESYSLSHTGLIRISNIICKSDLLIVGSTLYFKICSENNLSNIFFSVPDCTVSNDDKSMTYNIIVFG